MTTGQTILAIVGPTGAGKSALAARLARELDGEIVSADSRQVYRYMDIGTAKPSAEQRAAVPHHLIDIIDPDEEYSLALFLCGARAAIRDIQSRSRLPILAGGTGQYVRGLLEGWQVPHVPPDPELRLDLETRARVQGAAALHVELAGVDPKAARRIDPRNARRLIRALEVYRRRKEGLSSEPTRETPPFRPVVLGLTLERTSLYERINRRVEDMIQAGWVGEVEGLLSRGYSPDLPSMSSLGYRELAQHLGGDKSLEEGVAEIKQRTRRFARQQYGWFRLGDQRIRWFQGSPDGLEAAATQAREIFR
jgi:tRNA dimethylallyltransferase